jgi:GH15 family glucan-1,4-alpha-glucosidase
MLGTVQNYRGDVSVIVYTQITDVELEVCPHVFMSNLLIAWQCDGFFNYDRSSKFDSNSTSAIYDANVALIASSSKPRQ